MPINLPLAKNFRGSPTKWSREIIAPGLNFNKSPMAILTVPNSTVIRIGMSLIWIELFMIVHYLIE